MKYPRIMIAAPSSGSGKTLVTCGLLQALINRNKKVSAFKCGPDYIDPMFHTKAIGVPSRNLDTFFTDHDTVRYLFGKNAKGFDLSVIEGVMGFYDGVAGITSEASSWDVADATNTPVILVVNAKGMSLSAVALIRGFLEFCTKDEEESHSCTTDIMAEPSELNDTTELSAPDKLTEVSDKYDSHIRGIILNQVSASIYPELKQLIESKLPVKVLGYLPRVEDCVIESRHLGLVTPDEITDLKDRLNRLADVMEDTVDIDAVIELAEAAGDIDVAMPEHLRLLFEHCELCRNRNPVAAQCQPASSTCSADADTSDKDKDTADADSAGMTTENADAQRIRPRIAIAQDEAFCFYYEDNLDLLRELGAELVPFSPLHDEMLPENIQGLLLGGGYPELYAEQLSRNLSMRRAIWRALQDKLPCVAECGGFMYLHKTMEDMNWQSWPMVGAVRTEVFVRDRLMRFGYITLTALKPQLYSGTGGQIRGHEFHYFDSLDAGDAFYAKKPYRKRSWECIAADDHMAAGFPHLYYYSNPEFAMRFVEKCVDRL